MLQPSNNLSALFRSLGPGDAGLEAATKAAAPQVEQDWPLFKVVSPTKSEPTPPLSAHERELWNAQEKVRVELPRPALSMSGLSSKLAQSLSHISEQIAAEAAQSPVPAPAPAPAAQPVGELPKSGPDSLPETTPNAPGFLFAKLSAVIEPQDTEEKGSLVGLFEKSAAQPPLAQDAAPDSANTNDFLATIFSRLEAKEKVVAKPAEKRSSLMSRLGKR